MRSTEEAVFDAGEEFLGKFRIERLIGRGGMGEVYLARNHFLDQPVAIKVLPLRRSTDALFRERMQREAQAGARLAHDNLVKVLDGGVADENVVYIIMEFLDGAKTLRELTWKSGGLALTDALAYAIQLLDGLAAVHAAGILHRDLKPENVVVLPGGLLKIIDFGLARVRSSALRTTVVPEGQRMGTLHYMAPEQILGGDVGPTADVYAAGLILHEMVAGQHVFAQETDTLPSVQEVSIMHQLASPTRLDARKPSVPKELADVVQRMLAKDPASRLSALEAGAALERVLALVARGESTAAPAAGQGAHGTMMLPEGFVASHPLGPFAPVDAVATLTARALAGWSEHVRGAPPPGHVRGAPPPDLASGATPNPFAATAAVPPAGRSKVRAVVAGVAFGVVVVGGAMGAILTTRGDRTRAAASGPTSGPTSGPAATSEAANAADADAAPAAAAANTAGATPEGAAARDGARADTAPADPESADPAPAAAANAGGTTSPDASATAATAASAPTARSPNGSAAALPPPLPGGAARAPAAPRTPAAEGLPRSGL